MTRPHNFGILFVPHQSEYIVERMGKYHRTLTSGLNYLIPFIDKVRCAQSLKELIIDVPFQPCITKDNVSLKLDGILYYRIFDTYKASYGIKNPRFAISQLAQTAMRSEIGKLVLDSVFKERESLNTAIVEIVNKAALDWGITCLRYEIQEIQLPNHVQDAMHKQVEAERKKRAVILESEGLRQSQINKAEAEAKSMETIALAKKRTVILESEGKRIDVINKAEAESNALIQLANAQAESLFIISKSLDKDTNNLAASFQIAQQYIEAFSKLAKTTNTIIIPDNPSNINQMITQAMSIYKTIK